MLKFTCIRCNILPIPIAARSKAGVCGRSLVGNAGLNPAGVSCVICRQVEASATGRSLAQRRSTEYGVSVMSKPLQ